MKNLVKLNLTITIPERWVNKFLQMLDCMMWCGKAGASRTIAFYADGDGDFRPFEVEINGEKLTSDIKWHEHDSGWKPKDDNEIPPKFKTNRKIDFFFDAG